MDKPSEKRVINSRTDCTREKTTLSHGYVVRVVGKHVRLPAISTDTTSPYTAIIPDITTGISDYTKPSVSNCGFRGSCLPDFHDQLWLERPESGDSNPGFRGAKRRPDS